MVTARERFAEEFKSEAVRQVVERSYTVADVAKRLGASALSLTNGSEPQFQQPRPSTNLLRQVRFRAPCCTFKPNIDHFLPNWVVLYCLNRAKILITNVVFHLCLNKNKKGVIMRYSFLIFLLLSQNVFALDFPDSTNPTIKSMIERFKTDLPKIQSPNFFNIPNPAPSWPCEISENEKFLLAGSLSDEQLIKSENERAKILMDQGLAPLKNKRSNATVIPIAVQCKDGKVDTEEFDILLSYDEESLSESSYLMDKKMVRSSSLNKTKASIRTVKSKSDPYSPLKYTKFDSVLETHYDDKVLEEVSRKNTEDLKKYKTGETVPVSVSYQSGKTKAEFTLGTSLEAGGGFFGSGLKNVPTVTSVFQYDIDDSHQRHEGYTGKKISYAQTLKDGQLHGWYLTYSDNYLKKLKLKLESQPGMENAKEANIGGYDLIEQRLCYQKGLQVKAETCPSE